MPTLDEMIRQAERLERQSRILADDLRAYRTLQSASGAKQLKHPDGKLTEEGVRHLHAALEAGKTPTEIAAALDITVPAVLYRRANWRANRTRRPAR